MRERYRPGLVTAALTGLALVTSAALQYQRETRTIPAACASESPREVAIAAWQSMKRARGLAQTSDDLAQYCSKDLLERAEHAIHDPYSSDGAGNALRALHEAEATIDRSSVVAESR